MTARRSASALVARLGVAACLLMGCASLLSCPSALALGDVNSPECSVETEASPGFRTFMPDCRAYELVSPPYLSGQAALGRDGSPAMTADGDHLIAVDYAAFAGSENEEGGLGELGAFYEFSRTPTGWSAEALDPPASEYPHRRFVFTSADLSRSVWELFVPPNTGEASRGPEIFRAFGETNSFQIAIREQAGGGKGRFVAVGPMSAPTHEPEDNTTDFIVGASADLTHMLLLVGAERKQLWPGDDTREGATSVYEYRGVGQQEPVLVGVENEGAAPWEANAANVNDGAQLVSSCGTIYDGVSASGETVFFSAEHVEGCASHQPPVTELYARVGGSRTVKVSGKKPAEFRGASADGTKVFFVEGEQLYEYDFAAPEGERVLPVAPSIASVSAISRDGTRIYFQAPAVLTGEPNANGEAAQAGAQNLYGYDTETGHTAFVAREPDGEVQTTRDGQFLLFDSERDLEGTDDTSTVNQLFEYDAETGRVARVSSGQRSPEGYECEATHEVQEGFNCDGNTTSQPPKTITPADAGPAGGTSGLALAEDGAVVFVSADTLTPYAVAGSESENVYEYRAGNVYLISPGDEAARIGPRLMGLDESAKDVFFWTTDSLVPQDTGTQAAWYDAREQGGFPAPATQLGCAAGTCQGPASTAPLLPIAGGSETAAPGGNLAPSSSAPAGKPKPPTRKQQLASALKKCKKLARKRARASCESRARKKYATAKKAGRR
jgi:hypothetical protein